MIRFDSVTKLYGLVNGVNDVSVELGPGAYGLLGPNGSGKTTFINLITGQLRPTIGDVEVFGQNPWGKEEFLSRIGLCPAVDVLYSNVSAYDWVNYQVRLIGYGWKEAKECALRALALVGMSDAMHRRIGGYSLGMRQRTKLAQAIAHEPDLLILDEPYNGLDPIGRQEMTQLLNELIVQGKSVILASHVLHEVEEINPSLLLLSNGRLLAQGNPKEIQGVLASQNNETLPTSGDSSNDPENAIAPDFLDDQSSGERISEKSAKREHVEIFIRSNDNYALARELFKHTRLTNIQFSPDESELRIGTNKALEVFQWIPEVAKQNEIQFYEMRAADGSLDDLFSSLMKIHRGDSS